MAVVAAKFPSIQRLRLKYVDVVTELWREPLSRLAGLRTTKVSSARSTSLPDSFLSSLAHLERLSCLSINLRRELALDLGRVMQHLQHVDKMASLSFQGDFFYARHLELSALSCLWGRAAQK